MKWILGGVALALVAATLVSLFRDDVGSLLRQLTARRGALRSVAVLPLANLSGDPQQEFFADRMTDAVICQLARLGALRVISRTSVMRYKGTRASLEQIAHDLHVDAVVEGSVMRSGDAVRINAVLIDAGSDQQLWADDYERKVDDLLALQADVAGAIAREVRGHLSPDERARLASGERGAVPPNPAAEDAYLKGSYYASKPSRAMLGISVRFFKNATTLDSNYAVAWAGLATSCVLLAAMGSPESPAEYREAKLAAERALTLDEGQADAHVALGVKSKEVVHRGS
jgi:TolB-like protein